MWPNLWPPLIIIQHRKNDTRILTNEFADVINEC